MDFVRGDDLRRHFRLSNQLKPKGKDGEALGHLAAVSSLLEDTSRRLGGI